MHESDRERRERERNDQKVREMRINRVLRKWHGSCREKERRKILKNFHVKFKVHRQHFLTLSLSHCFNNFQGVNSPKNR